MDKNEQKIEGSENPSNQNDNAIKAKENQKEMGYSSVLGEYKSEEGKNENKEKSTNQTSENQLNEPATSFNSGTSAFSSPNDDKNKDLKVDAGLKSTSNQPIEDSTGYTSSKIGNKETKEGVLLNENPQTGNVGLKSTVGQPITAKTNISSSSYNSATGAYSSSSSCNNQINNSNVVQTQPVITPLIIQVPSNAPILNKNIIPIGNVQGSITMTSKITTTTTTTTTKTTGMTQIQPPIISQQMPFGQPQPLESTTFAEYPQTVSHGIKSSNMPSADNQPK